LTDLSLAAHTVGVRLLDYVIVGLVAEHCSARDEPIAPSGTL